MSMVEPQIRRWTRDEYYRLAEEGFFHGQRILLIEGEIIQMPPTGHAHAKAMQRVLDALRPIFGPAHWVRCQMPLNVGTDSDPEPDVAVVPGKPEDFADHPTTAALIVEVSDISLRLDRSKVPLYAAARVEEYWIVNIEDRVLELYRHPVGRDSAGAFHYGDRQIAHAGETVTPVVAPGSAVSVGRLFE